MRLSLLRLLSFSLAHHYQSPLVSLCLTLTQNAFAPPFSSPDSVTTPTTTPAAAASLSLVSCAGRLRLPSIRLLLLPCSCVSLAHSPAALDASSCHPPRHIYALRVIVSLLHRHYHRHQHSVFCCFEVSRSFALLLLCIPTHSRHARIDTRLPEHSRCHNHCRRRRCRLNLSTRVALSVEQPNHALLLSSC